MPQEGFDPPKQSAAQVLKLSRRSTSKPPRLDGLSEYFSLIFLISKIFKKTTIKPSLSHTDNTNFEVGKQCPTNKLIISNSLAIGLIKCNWACKVRLKYKLLFYISYKYTLK